LVGQGVFVEPGVLLVPTSSYNGGGSGCSDDSYGGPGGGGGGIVFIMCSNLTLSGAIISNGGNGAAYGGDPFYSQGCGGGGAGGSIIIKAQNVTLGAGLIQALGGSGGSQAFAQSGGAGSVGRIRIEACSRTGTTNPSASESIGGHSFCANNNAIL